ncbi:MAG: type II toxin-antitoxin system HicA family toxin [Polyangiaceae bacterium]
MRSSPKSWRQLQDELRQLGATAVRTKGSHEIWRFSDGEIFVVVCHHPHRAVDGNVLAKFRRLRARRREPGGPPLPLGRTRSRWPRRAPRVRSDHVKS